MKTFTTFKNLFNKPLHRWKIHINLLLGKISKSIVIDFTCFTCLLTIFSYMCSAFCNRSASSWRWHRLLREDFAFEHFVAQWSSDVDFLSVKIVLCLETISWRMKTIALNSWDENQCVRSFISICQLVKTNDLSFVMGNLGRLTERFYERALDPTYESKLTAAGNLELEKEFEALTDWIQSSKECVLKHKMQVTTKLQVDCTTETFFKYCILCSCVYHLVDQHPTHCSLYFGQNKQTIPTWPSLDL